MLLSHHHPKQQQLYQIFTKSFRVPDEVNVIREKTILDEKNDNKKEWYIVKPDRGRCGVVCSCPIIKIQLMVGKKRKQWIMVILNF